VPDPLPYGARPLDPTPVHTDELPPTPVRDRSIPASSWVEAPPRLLALGDDLPVPADATAVDRVPTYKRRIGRWLLWRVGPATGADARYLAIDAADLGQMHEFRLRPDGRGEGAGPSGALHDRFRSWKEDLRDHG
jgi:hypothetical protein